jgi:uncharacterized membrane protein
MPATTPTIALTFVGAIGVVVSFVATVLSFSAIESAGKGVKLTGADIELGYPSSAFALVLFAVLLAVAVAGIAGAALTPGWWVAILPVSLIGVVFEIWSLYLAILATPVDVLSVILIAVQLVVMATAAYVVIRNLPRARPGIGFGAFLVTVAVMGFFSAFRLTVDKVDTFVHPTSTLSCNFSLLVQCGANLRSWQGSLFGFPNPLLGIGGWIAVLLVGIMLLSGLRFARWFWIAFNIGILGAFALVCWLISQSVFVLTTLCPWCMATWTVVIPLFWLVTFRNFKEGVFGSSPRVHKVFGQLYAFVPLVTLVSYIAIIVIIQVRLDLLSYL